MMPMHSTRHAKNGSEARAIVFESLPVMFCSTNKLKPTGGVTSAISTSSTMKMPNQTTSNPALIIIGSTTVEVSTIIEMPSSAVPSRM